MRCTSRRLLATSLRRARYVPLLLASVLMALSFFCAGDVAWTTYDCHGQMIVRRTISFSINRGLLALEVRSLQTCASQREVAAWDHGTRAGEGLTFRVSKAYQDKDPAPDSAPLWLRPLGIRVLQFKIASGVRPGPGRLPGQA